MTKQERYERNQNIINDIKHGMTNAQITEKYGIAERTIRRILDDANMTRTKSLGEKTGGGTVSDDKDTLGEKCPEADVFNDKVTLEEKVPGGDTFDDKVADIEEENDRLQEQIELMQKAFNSELANLTAKFSKLESDTARINTATIGYINPDEDHYIIGVKPFDDIPGVPPKAYNLEETLELFRKYRPMRSEDQVMDTLKKYGHTNRDCGKLYFKASSGSSINDYNVKFKEINTKLDKLEERLSAIEEQL